MMLRSQKPCVQIPEDYVNHREVLVRLGMVALYCQRYVPVAQLFQAFITSPPVRSHLRSWPYVLQDEGLQHFLLAVWDDLETQPASDHATPVSSLMLRALPGRQIRVGTGSLLLSRTYLYDTGYKRLVGRPRPAPCVAPPTYVSSTSTGHSPPIPSRSGRTIAARNLCSMLKAVS